jgi:hypothetical protein
VTEVDRLFAEYIAEHAAGGDAAPHAFLDRAAAADRPELTVLIDGFLSGAPRQPFTRGEFAGSGAEAVVDQIERSLGGMSGLWPALLPELRHRAGLKRTELVGRLATALEVTGRQEKVAGYYHEMEQGLLPAAGVSDRVLDALAGIVGSTVEALREAGAALSAPGGPGPAAAGGTAFARQATPWEQPEAAAPLEPSQAEPETEPDDIDRLFRGG